MFSLLAFMTQMKNNNTVVLEISYIMYNVHHTGMKHLEIPCLLTCLALKTIFE